MARLSTFLAVLLSGLLFAATPRAETRGEIIIGSKKFTESVILGEIVSHLLRASGAVALHRRELGGTRVLWEALKAGDIDVYPEYTGTLAKEIFAAENPRQGPELLAALARRDIAAGGALGFNNTYALGVRAQTAKRLGLRSISDLRRHPALVFGFGNEFMNRADGWPGLRRHYRLPQSNVRGLDHDLAYRGLAAGDIDALDTYTTDAEIAYYGLALLEDDLGFFPVYDAVLVYRAGLARRAPAAVAAFARLEGAISAARMQAMNAEVKLGRRSEAAVAADFVAAEFGIEAALEEETMISRLMRRTIEHLTLVGLSLSAAILVALPLGIFAQRRPRAGQVVLSIVGVIQTILSLALFVFMIPFLGIGGPAAVVALFLYSLLPIVRNTHDGLCGIPLDLRESAEALGLPPGARLRQIELPLAARTIMGGIKTSAVINVGTATLGALIGAGGYGQPILTGIRLDDLGLILEGAVPAALLALAAQALFDAAEKCVVPQGLRLKPAE